MMADHGADEPVEGHDAELFARPLPTTRRSRFGLGLVVGGVITVAVVLLIIQNGESTQLDWLVFDFEAPLWIMLALTLAAGAVVWELGRAGWHRSRRLRAERRTAIKAANDRHS
jgi:uncharacterized integral membrane protein